MAELDINKLKASVASMTPANADADVRLEATETGPEFVFSFKLPPGKDGKDGTNVIGVVLTDENVWVPCLDDGTPDPDLKEHASTKIILQDGDQVITKGVSYKLTIPDTDGEFKVDPYGDVSVILTKDSAEVIEITCTAIYNKVEHSRTFRVKKAIGVPVYKVVPDVSAIKQDNAIKVPGELRVDVLKWNGKNWGKTSELPVMYNYTEVEGNITHKGQFADKISQDEDTFTYVIDVQNLNNLKSLEVYIEKDDIVLDYQSVSIVKDGIGMISAVAYTTVSSDLDLSDCTVTGGSYWTINDPDTYNTFITQFEENNLDITGYPTNSNQRNDAQKTGMISQVFSSTDDPSEDQVGSFPIVLQDSDIFQVEYSAKDVETPPKPLSFQAILLDLLNNGADRATLTSEVLEAKGRELEAAKDDPGVWSDTVENPKWMATCRLQNGEGTNGTVTKCRGEIGYNAQQIELSNESEYVPCVNVTNESDTSKSYGMPDPDLYLDGKPIASTEVVLMDGHENITDKCKIEITCSDSAINDGTGDSFAEHESFDGSGNKQGEFVEGERDDAKVGILNVYQINEDVTHFTITLTYANERHGNNVQYKGTFKIVKVKNATTYKISTDVNVVKIDSVNTAHPGTLEVSLLKGNGQRGEQITDLSADKTYGFTATCSGVSNSNQKNEVTEIPSGAKKYENGKFIINIEDDDLGTNGYPGQFIFSVPITTEDGTPIGTEKESIPVMSDGINITGVYEYYTSTLTNTAPTFSGEGIPEVDDANDYGTNDKLAQNLKDGSGKVGYYNNPPKLDETNKYLWNVEVVTNSGGDIVEVTNVALVGTYGTDGMSPYKILEFYDVSATRPEDKQDPISEFTLGNKQSPTAEYPYLYGFERVLYSVDEKTYKFSSESYFYDSNKNAIETPAINGEDKKLYDAKLIKYVDTPISLISKIGAGSFTEQLYKYFAQGTTTEKSPTTNALKVPADTVGSYAYPAPGYKDSPYKDGGEGWEDGVPESNNVYDFNGNKISKYEAELHGGKILYMTLRTYTTDGESPQTGGSTPTIASDIEGKVDFQGSTSVDKPPKEPYVDGNDDGSDNATNAIGMAVRYMSTNGVWEEGTISKIKGEKGDTGASGPSGDPGTSPLHLELLNDFTMVMTDFDGDLLGKGDEDTSTSDVDGAYTEAQLFCGLDNVTSKATFEGAITEGTSNDTYRSDKTKFGLTDMSSDKVIVTCTATYKNQSIKKDFTVNKSKGQPVFKLSFAAQYFVKKKTGSITPTVNPVKVLMGIGSTYRDVTNQLNKYNLKIINAETKQDVMDIQAQSSPIKIQLITRNTNVVLDEETIGVLEDGTDGDPGDDAPTVDTVEVTGYAGSITTAQPSDSSFTKTAPEGSDGSDGKSKTGDYLGAREVTTYSNNATTTKYYITSIKGKTGATGATGGPGGTGPVIYPAGVGVAGKEYEVDSNKVPYVYVVIDYNGNATTEENAYGMLNKDTSGNAATINPTQPDQNYGTKIPYHEAIYADIGLFNQALVGSWVFHEDYMFSQVGTGKLTGETAIAKKSYSDFSDPAIAINTYFDKKETLDSTIEGFKPNVLFNAKTGKSLLGDIVIEDGTATVKKLDTQTTGLMRTIIDDDGLSVVDTNNHRKISIIEDAFSNIIFDCDRFNLKYGFRETNFSGMSQTFNSTRIEVETTRIIVPASGIITGPITIIMEGTYSIDRIQYTLYRGNTVIDGSTVTDNIQLKNTKVTIPGVYYFKAKIIFNSITSDTTISGTAGRFVLNSETFTSTVLASDGIGVFSNTGYTLLTSNVISVYSTKYDHDGRMYSADYNPTFVQLSYESNEGLMSCGNKFRFDLQIDDLIERIADLEDIVYQ